MVKNRYHFELGTIHGEVEMQLLTAKEKQIWVFGDLVRRYIETQWKIETWNEREIEKVEMELPWSP